MIVSLNATSSSIQSSLPDGWGLAATTGRVAKANAPAAEAVQISLREKSIIRTLHALNSVTDKCEYCYRVIEEGGALLQQDSMLRRRLPLASQIELPCKTA